MNRIRVHAPRRAQGGTSMIEVLVAIVIVVVGLLGLAGLQSRAALAEMESFQRGQAIILMQDMVDRINANRRNSMSYVTSTPLGTGDDPQDCAALTGPARDKCEWHNALLGAAEQQGGSNIGAMIGARGCVENLDPAMPRRFRVSVVWQGLSQTFAPGATMCGKDQYGTETARRAVTTTFIIGCLQNDPVSFACMTP
jgi:type IV pilus assembly protein PilV